MTTTQAVYKTTNTRKPRKIAAIDARIEHLYSLTPQARACELIKDEVERTKRDPFAQAKAATMAKGTREAIAMRPWTCHYTRDYLSEQCQTARIANSREMIKQLAELIHPNDSTALCDAMLSMLANLPTFTEGRRDE